jgi:hypothetical protein
MNAEHLGKQTNQKISGDFTKNGKCGKTVTTGTSAALVIKVIMTIATMLRRLVTKLIIAVGTSSRQGTYFGPILIRVEFSGHILVQHANMKLGNDLSSGSRVVPCGRTDGRAGTTN